FHLDHHSFPTRRSSDLVIGEDLVFVGLGVLLLRGLKGWSGMRSGRAAAVLLPALAVSATFVVASPSLPIDAYVTRLRVGRNVARSEDTRLNSSHDQNSY